MKNVFVVSPELGYGGTDAVAVSILDALKDDHAVEFISTRKPDFKALNEFFKSSIDNKISVRKISVPFLFESSSRARLLKQHLLMRYCKRNKNKAGLFISSYGEMDFGVRGIQYIHFPEVVCEAKFVLNSFFYKRSPVRSFYQYVCKLVSGYSDNNVKSNLTLVNSQWTKKIVDKLYGIDSIVVYPPVLEDCTEVSWRDKKNGFIFIGRISPDKRPLDCIKIIKKIREKGVDTHIHIIGNSGLDGAYVNAVKKESELNPSWVFYEGKVSRDRLRELISSHKYGINGKKFEHFGIAIAEMACAGNIVFVNDDGGQVEIVGKNEALIYHSEDDAVNKIEAVLKSDNLQQSLLGSLKQSGALYSKESFVRQIRGIVERFLESKT